MSKVKITLVRSPINRNKQAKATVKALGLRKMHQSIIHEDTPPLRGMINSVSYMLKEEKVDA